MDLQRQIDSTRLTHYISSWSLEPQIDAAFLDKFNHIVRAETRQEVEVQDVKR